MGEELGLTLTGSGEPGPCLGAIASQSLELPHGPPDKVLVDAPCEGVQLGAVEEGGGRELPPPAPVKPDVTVSRHPAYYSARGAEGLLPVAGLAQASLRSPRPSLQGHYSPFITTTPRSAPVHRIRYSRLRLSASAYSRSLCCQRDDGTTGSRVPSKSPHHAHAPFTPDTAWPGTRQPARLIPGQSLDPGSDAIDYFSTRHRKVRFRSSSWCTPDGGSSAVCCNAQDPGS